MPKYAFKFNPFSGDLLLQEDSTTDTIVSSGGVFENIPMSASIVFPDNDFPTYGGSSPQTYVQTHVKDNDEFKLHVVVESGYTPTDIFLHESASWFSANALVQQGSGEDPFDPDTDGFGSVSFTDLGNNI